MHCVGMPGSQDTENTMFVWTRHTFVWTRTLAPFVQATGMQSSPT